MGKGVSFCQGFTTKFWYMACNMCYKGTSAQYMETFQCVHIKREEAIAEPRS